MVRDRLTPDWPRWTPSRDRMVHGTSRSSAWCGRLGAEGVFRWRAMSDPTSLGSSGIPLKEVSYESAVEVHVWSSYRTTRWRAPARTREMVSVPNLILYSRLRTHRRT